MNKRFVITTAVGLVLATTAFAQSPNGSTSSSTTQPSATTTRPSTSTTAPSASQSAPAATAPSGTAAQSMPPAPNTTTTQSQGQAPSTRGTAQSQPSQPANPSAAQSAPTTQQPATSQAQTPSQSNQAQTPAQSNQPATNNAQAPSSNTNINATANIGPQDRTRIAQSISRLNVQPLTNVNFSVAVGTTIPRNVRLQPLPTDIVQVVPQYRGYNFVVVRDEIVIVEPSTYRIVDVLPRSGGRAAAAPAPAQKTMKFSNRERAVIRRHVTTARDRVTVGSTARAQVRIGDRVPDTVELREFPSTIYRTVPSVREYRYMQMDNRSYLVEPRERVIIEQID
jgi:hypothetical protein